MIDGGVFLGRNPTSGLQLDARAFERHLADNGLSAAVVSSYKSIYFDDREGNRDVMELYRRMPRSVIPAITLNPLRWDSSKSTQYLQQMKDAGAKVLCLFSTPAYYPIHWDSPVLMSLIKEASHLGYVIQLGIKNETEFAQVLARFSGVRSPILIRWMGSAAYRGLTEAIHALRTSDNIYFDVASLTGVGMIGYLAETVDPKKLYWASNAPEQNVSAARHLLQAASLKPGTLHAMTKAGLSEIFARQHDSLKRIEPSSNRWASIPKIDTHWHLEHWNLLEPGADLKTYPALFKKLNIKKAIFSSIRALNGHMREGNRGTFETATKMPGVYGLVVVDPSQPEASLREIRRYVDHPRCVGLKTIQDLYDAKLNDASYQKILDMAEKNRLTVMAHLPGLKEAAIARPGVNFVAAHSTWGRVKDMIGAPNIFFDLATSHRQNAESQLSGLVKNAGAGQILFASDAPLMHPAWTIGKIESEAFDRKTLQQIYHDNALKAFPRLLGRKK